MKIIISKNKILFQLGANFYAAPFSFAQLAKNGTTYFQFKSIDESIFSFEQAFEDITDSLNAPFASVEILRNLLLSYSGESTDLSTAIPTVTSFLGNGALETGLYSAISLVFRGAGGTLNGTSVPDGYTFSVSTDGSRKLGGINFTVPTSGELRVIATMLS